MLPTTKTTAFLSAAAVLHHFERTHGVWLCATGVLRSPARAIVIGARRAGMLLDILALNCAPFIPFWHYDLIILEAAHNETPTLLVSVIRQARLLSCAPVVVLAPQAEHEMLVTSLNAGADAVLSIHTPRRVLFAHWGALLRRREINRQREGAQSANSARRWMS